MGQGKPLKITNGPVIEAVSPNSAVVAWSTNEGGSSVIKYGTESTNLTQTAQAPYVSGTHRVTLRKLLPNTTYYFQIVSAQGAGNGSEAQSSVIQLITPQNPGTLIPLYRLVSASTGSHLFTTNTPEKNSALTQGFKLEGVAGYIYKDQAQGTEPFYRLRNSSNDHFYTSSTTERDAVEKQGYTLEGVAGYIGTTQASDTVPLHRLIAANGEHFYSASDTEIATAKTQGLKDEGIAGYVWQVTKGD